MPDITWIGSFAGLVALGLLACCSTSAEPPTAPHHEPNADVRQAAAEPATHPPKQDHSWDSVDEAMEGYQQVVAGGWLESGQVLWLRSPNGCSAFTLRPSGEELTASVQLCSRAHGRKQVRCKQSITLAGGMFSLGMALCKQDNPDGTGHGSFAGSPQTPSWSPMRIEDDVVELGPAYRLWVEPEHLVWVTARCESGTEKTARRSLEREGVEDVDGELFERFGVVNGEQRCRVDEGMALFRRDVSDHGIYDRGARSKTLEQPANCSNPCPENPHFKELSARNKALAGRRFYRVGEDPTGYLYLSQAACEGAGHPPLVSSSCDLLDSP